MAPSFGDLGDQVCEGSAFADYPDIPSPRRFALVVRGESYRSGHGQGDRDDSVTNESWHTQKEASTSHVEQLVKPLQECGFEVDVFIATYGHSPTPVTRNSTRDLLAFYKHHVMDSLVVPIWKKESYNQARMYLESINLVSRFHKKHRVAYDGIFVVRHDVILKQPPFTLPDVQWQNVLLPFQELTFFANRVGDVVQWFPWRFSNCATKCGFVGHHGDCLKEQVGPGNLGFLVQGQHNSNTRSESNQLYRLIRGMPHERHTAVLFACGRPFGPENGGESEESLGETLKALGKSFERHILKPNNQHVAEAKNKVDVLAHCWAPTLEAAFREAFNPVVASFERLKPLDAMFRDKPGVGHHYWESIAWAYSVQRVLQLLEEHEQRTDTTYNRVLLLRPDMLVLSDLDLDVIMMPSNDPAVHSGTDLGSNAEFHLAMSRDFASMFGQLLDRVTWNHPAQSHSWIKYFVEEELNTTVLEDDIVSGVDELSYWKLANMVKQEPMDKSLLRRLVAEGIESIGGLRLLGEVADEGSSEAPAPSTSEKAPWDGMDADERAFFGA